MTNKLPLEEWCSSGGISMISYDTRFEYIVLNKVLESLAGSQITLIHSKQIRDTLPSNITLIDATGHGLTETSVLHSQLTIGTDYSVIDNPEDTRLFLNKFHKLTKIYPDTEYWVWWSPSDLLTHDLDERAISKCIRIMAKDYSDLKILILIVNNVHSKQGFAILEYISESHYEYSLSESGTDDKHKCCVIKHPNVKLEGEMVEF